MSRALFLLGGSQALEAAALDFVSAAGGHQACLALLLQGGQNWQKYVPVYAGPLNTCGVRNIQVIVPGEDGQLDLTAAGAVLEQASGIIIGGGNTAAYQRLYAASPLGEQIRSRYQAGIPYLGISAGALIALEHCLLGSEESGDGTMRIAPGLGLVQQILLGVHFTERNALPELLAAMAQTQTQIGWGLDEGTCAIFEEERFARVAGRSAYRVEMEDFSARTYRVSLFPTGYACAARSPYA